MKIAIYGYGNLGKGVELAIRQNDDMELFGVFTRRSPDSLKLMTEGVGVYSASDIEKYKEMFKNECESKMDLDGMAFLYGKVANDTVIGGIASEGDLNALALVVAYSNNLNSDKQTTRKLVRSLEELCRSLALHKGSNEEREAFKYLKNVYNACSMNGKDIEAIAHWEK